MAEGRKLYKLCSEIVKDTQYEYMIKKEEISEMEKQRLAKSLRAWDNMWKENFQDKYGKGE